MSTGADNGLAAIFGYGGETTSAALSAVASAQRRGATVLFVDTAQKFDIGSARKAGVNIADLVVMHPEDADKPLRAIRLLVEKKAIGFVVIDRAPEFFALDGDEKAAARRVKELARFAAASRIGCAAAVRVAQMRGKMFGNLAIAAAEDALRRRAKNIRCADFPPKTVGKFGIIRGREHGRSALAFRKRHKAEAEMRTHDGRIRQINRTRVCAFQRWSLPP